MLSYNMNKTIIPIPICKVCRDSEFLKDIKCPYCGYDGGPEYGTNMPYIDNLGVLKMDCAKCTRKFNIRRR